MFMCKLAIYYWLKWVIFDESNQLNYYCITEYLRKGKWKNFIIEVYALQKRLSGSINI